jgi:hypothetical protein
MLRNFLQPCPHRFQLRLLIGRQLIQGLYVFLMSLARVPLFRGFHPLYW